MMEESHSEKSDDMEKSQSSKETAKDVFKMPLAVKASRETGPAKSNNKLMSVVVPVTSKSTKSDRKDDGGNTFDRHSSTERKYQFSAMGQESFSMSSDEMEAHSSKEAATGVFRMPSAARLAREMSLAKSNSKLMSVVVPVNSTSAKSDNKEHRDDNISERPVSTEKKYQLSEIKNGVIVKRHWLTKPKYTLGRSEQNDFVLFHESISSFHAILKYGSSSGNKKDEGYYLMDLGSKNTTKINKTVIKPNIFYHIKSGETFKFGFSTRFYLLDVVVDDPGRTTSDDETAEVKRSAKEGIDWGQKEEADETSDPCPSYNYFSTPNEDEYNNPEKIIRTWFTNEYKTPDFKITKEGRHYKCTLIVPLSGISVEYSDYVAEGIGDHKADAIKRACVDACNRLTHLGFGVKQFDSKSKRAWSENDYYDSDEDPYFDQTGELEKKRAKRRKVTGTETRECVVHNAASLKSDLIGKVRLKSMILAALDCKYTLNTPLKKTAERPHSSEAKVFIDELVKCDAEINRLYKLLRLADPMRCEAIAAEVEADSLLNPVSKTSFNFFETVFSLGYEFLTSKVDSFFNQYN